MINTIDFCPVKGTKGHYVHDCNGKVYSRKGQEITKDSDGKFELVIGFQPVKLSYAEIFPYKKIVAEKVEPKKVEPKKSFKKGK